MRVCVYEYSTICTKRTADFLRLRDGDLSANPLRKKEIGVIIGDRWKYGVCRTDTIPNGTFI